MTDCVLLSIDSAKASGAVILVPNEGRASKELSHWFNVKTAGERAMVVATAQEVAAVHGLPFVVVGEAWGVGGRRMTPAMAMGLGAGWGRWAEQLELAGVPESHVLRVKVADWRKAIFGPKNRKRDEWKRMAVAWCKARYGYIFTDDVAEALCMGIATLDSAKLKKLLRGRER